MIHKAIKYYIIIILLLAPINILSAVNPGLSGRILLQVEENGEAWYVHPDNLVRHFLGRPDDAYQVMREQGVGITNYNLSKIPVALDAIPGIDSDSDGLVDLLEDALGTKRNNMDTDGDGFNDRFEIERNFNPLGLGVMPVDYNFTNAQKGKIFLQVESHGEAWYVDPISAKRYYLGRAIDAWQLMRTFGLGITNHDLASLTILDSKTDYNEEDHDLPDINNYSANFNLELMEKIVHMRINEERVNQGYSELKWNNDLTTVSREHSRNLALENEAFAGFGVTCDYPIIHHEGVDFGPYNSDRLKARGVHYLSKAGENIALVSGAEVLVLFKEDDPLQFEIEACPLKRDNFDNSFQLALDRAEEANDKIAIIKSEIVERTNAYKNETSLEIAEVNWHSSEALARDMVEGWMDSPGHRQNILEESFDETGVGLAEVNGYIISTQIFIKRADCGYQGGPCCEELGYYPYCFVPLECEINICN